MPAQLCPELKRLEPDGLVDVAEVPQERRPRKRVVTVNDAGRAELRRSASEPSRPFSLKDELIVRLRTGADTDPEATIEALRQRRDLSAAKLERYVTIRKDMLRRRTETQFATSARSVGPPHRQRRNLARALTPDVARRDDRLPRSPPGAGVELQRIDTSSGLTTRTSRRRPSSSVWRVLTWTLGQAATPTNDR